MKKIYTFIFMFLLLPFQYEYNQCELIAKNFQEEYGGNLVFIQPLKNNGAFEFGDYSGHWLNSKTIDGNKYFIDYQNQRIFTNKSQVLSWYFHVTTKNSKIYELNVDNVPFAIKYHY